eukprot:6205151-Pleurochrysis_carterae.AAC.2
MVSHSIPNRERNAAIPSGRLNGPEISKRTRRERAAAPTTWSAVRTSCGEEIWSASGRPGGSDDRAG